jgi:hypothetical protein
MEGSTTIFDALRRVTLRPRRSSDWSVLVFGSRHAEPIESLREAAVALGYVIELASIDAMFRRDSTKATTNTIVVVDTRTFAAAEWRLIDLSRSRLDDSAPVVLVASEASFQEMARVAPNFSSIVGASVFKIDDERGADATEARLAELRAAHPEISDHEVIARAERRDPLDDNLVEWLVLMGRADLL